MHSLLKEPDGERRAIIAGHSVCIPYAASSAQLIHKLKRGEQVAKTLWFRSDEEAEKCGFKGNASVAKLTGYETLTLIYRLVDEALHQAQLNKKVLTGDNVRVYITGTGPRIDGMDYRAFYSNNDIEDLKSTPSITHLHAANMSQDYIACHLARHYQLRYLPPNIHSASNSSLAAIYLSCEAIKCGNVELAVIINCSEIKTQDIWFLESQSMLNSKQVQPFGENSDGVLYAEGVCVMVLENEQRRLARKLTDGIYLRSAYTQISASRSNDTSWVSINLLKLLKKILTEANIGAEDLSAIIPHGNGSTFTDRAEESAILSLMATAAIPVLAYKGQIGYTSTGSGIIDLIIGEYALREQQLLSPAGSSAIVSTLAPYVLLNQGIVKHTKQHLLKIGIGMDGSIIVMILANKAGG